MSPTFKSITRAGFYPGGLHPMGVAVDGGPRSGGEPVSVACPTVKANTIPTFSIVAVVTDQTVTIQTYNFPASQIFTVRMGAYGTAGIGGVVVAQTNSGAGGSFQETYPIPDALKGRTHRHSPGQRAGILCLQLVLESEPPERPGLLPSPELVIPASPHSISSQYPDRQRDQP